MDAFDPAQFLTSGHIRGGRVLRPDELNSRFNTTVPERTWKQLIDSIPERIKDILKKGNGPRQYDHAQQFMALPDTNGRPIQTFKIQNDGSMVLYRHHKTPTGPILAQSAPMIRGQPGQIMEHGLFFPRIRQLKKIKIATSDSTGPMIITPIDYAIPIQAPPAYNSYRTSLIIQHSKH